MKEKRYFSSKKLLLIRLKFGNFDVFEMGFFPKAENLNQTHFALLVKPYTAYTH
jgi:hypothetical protein